MVENFAKWPSERGQPAKVRSSEGCGGNGVSLAVECRYDCHGFEGYLGKCQIKRRPASQNHIAGG